MIILAFPGMGKTPLSKSSSKYLDLDFGHYRSAHQVAKEKEDSLIPSFARLAKMYSHDGYIVLSNEPKLMKTGQVSRVYLPQGKGLKFSARKLGVSTETVEEWVNGWAETAVRHSIPVTFLSVGLDHYLSSPKKGAKK